RLGPVTLKQAQTWKAPVEDLIGASLTRGGMQDATAVWLADLPDESHAKLAAVGLVSPRDSTTLGPWLEKYLAGRGADLKPRSRGKLGQTKAKLLAFFDAGTPLRSMTPDQAADWRQW